MKANYGKTLSALVLLSLVGSIGMAEQPLTTVYVQADKMNLIGGGFSHSEFQQGLLGKRTIMQTPFSQVNLSNKTIEIFSDVSQPTTSVLQNVPSVRSSTSTLYNDYSIRGQNASSYQFRINGIPNIVTQMNMGIDFVERVDVTSGPAMGVNGGGKESPGGVINFVSKKALEHDMTAFTVSFAGRSSLGGRIDLSKRIGDEKSWGIRVNGEYVDGQTGVVGDIRTNKDIYINVDHKDDRSSTNLLLGYRNNISEGGQRYLNIGSTDLTKMIATPSGKQNFSFDGQRLGMRTTMALLNHTQKLNDTVSFFMNAATAVNDGYDYVMTAWSRLDILNANGDFSRELNNEPYMIKGKYAQLGFKGTAKTESLTHEWSISWDKSWYDDFWGETKKTRMDNGEAKKELMTGNIYTGVWAITGKPINAMPQVASGRAQYTGWRALDVISFDKVEVTLGYQYQQASIFSVGSKSRTVTSGSSPLFGIVYRPIDKLAFYASHSESFERGTVVNTNYANAGEVLEPAKMKSNEFGIKVATDGILGSLAFFDMKRSSTFEFTKPNEQKPYLVMDGKTSYKGVELSVNGSLNDKWSIMGGLMYLEATYDKTNSATLQGNPVKGTADWSAVVGASYKVGKQWEFVGRMVYTGEAPVYVKDGKRLMVPSSTVFDLGARYHTMIGDNPVTFNAMIYNVFDKNYWSPRPGYDYVILGNPRTISLSATMKW